MFKVKNLFAAIFLAACVFWGMWAYHAAIKLGPQPLLRRADVDEIAIVQGAQGVDSWTEAMKWWTGPSIAYPQTKFYRPLSSTLYWLEYRAFGAQGFAGFMLVHWMSHVLVCVLALVLFRRLVSPNIAVLAVGLWASYAVRALTLSSPAMALYSWVGSVEMWFSTAALAYLLAGHFYLRSGNWRWFAASLPCFVLAVAVKEMAYMLPLLFLLLAWYERQLGLWRQWWPLVLLVLCGLAWRFYVLGGAGQTFGSNGSWLIRWVQFNLGGRVASLAMQGNLFGPGAASFLAALFLALAGKRRLAALLAVAGTGFIIVTDTFWSVAFGDAWISFWLPILPC